MERSHAVEILAVPGIPLVAPGDDLVALIAEGLARGGIAPRGGDVFVLAQKIVSKAEGRMRRSRDRRTLGARRSSSPRKSRRTRASSS